MRAIIFLFAFLILLFFSNPFKILAAFSLSIASINPDNVSNNEQEVIVSININDLPSESYFRVAWQESSGKPYFGYMKDNSGNWVKTDSGQNCINYYKVSDLTTTSLTLITKIGDENTINSGQYHLKARRYTNTCSSYADSDSVLIQVNLPTSTPTQTPTPTPTSKPSSIPIPTATKTPTPTKTIPNTPTPTQIITPTKTEVLGNETQNNSDVNQKIENEDNMEIKKQNNNFLPLIFIAIGVVFLLACAIVFLYPKIREYVDNKNE